MSDCRRRALFEELHECMYYIGNKPIEFVNSLCHLADLGHLINSELSDDDDNTKSGNNFIAKLIILLSYFRSFDSLVLDKLFLTYCTSYYGCKLWLLNNSKLEDLCVAWRKDAENMETPSAGALLFVTLISGCLPTFDELCRRSMSFLRS